MSEGSAVGDHEARSAEDILALAVSAGSVKGRRRRKEQAVQVFRHVGLKQLRAQSLLHNSRGQAKRCDDLLLVQKVGYKGRRLAPAPRRRRLGRPGAVWKTWTSEATLKAAFGPLAGPNTSKAPAGSSPYSAAQASHAVASALVGSQCKQTAKRGRMLDRLVGPAGFYITNTMHDETQLWLRDLGKRKRKKRRRVLAAFGQVTWGDESGVREDCDTFRVPAILPVYTAATCANVVAAPDDATGLLPRGSALPRVSYFASLMSTDSHSVNKLLSKLVVSQLEELRSERPGCNFFHLPSYCCQHKTGNTVESVTKYLQVYSPAFCVASLLTWGDVADDLCERIDRIIEQELLVVNPEEATAQGIDTGPCPLGRFLLEQCYVQIGVNSSPGGIHDQFGDPCVNIASKQRKRRQEAEDLLTFFSGRWGSHERLVHICSPGCCADRSASVVRAQKLAKLIVSPSITPPAMNKYTKVDPVVRQICLLSNLFGLFRRALAEKVGSGRRRVGDGDNESDMSQDACVGAPMDEVRHLRKIGRLKHRRANDFMARRFASWTTLIWIAVCDPVMVVHYRLFKHGKWYSHRRADRCSIYDFCGSMGSNPVASALSSLAGIVLSPEEQLSGPLAGLFAALGPIEGWPSFVRSRLHVAALLAFSGLWRKLFFSFKCYPWLLAPAFDVRRSDEERRQTLSRFLNADACCLDAGLCAPLRALRRESDGQPLEANDFFNSLLEEFLIAVFDRVVVTSTQVELMFSHLTRWTVTPDTGIGIASLAAKSLLTQFRQAVERWRRSVPVGSRSIACNNKRRAPWMFPHAEGRNVNHLHLFMTEKKQWESMSDAKVAFAALSPGEQQRYRERALVERTRARVTPSRLELVLQEDDADKLGYGPLQMSSADGPFPMLASSFRLETGGRSLTTLSAEWVKQSTTIAAESADSHCDPERREACVGVCRSDLRSGDIDVEHLWNYVRLAVRYTYDDHLDDPMVVLKFVGVGSHPDGLTASDLVKYVLVSHAQRHGDSLFEAEFVRLCIVPVTVVDPKLPFVLRLGSAQVEGTSKCWPDILDEMTLIRLLRQVSDDWVIWRASSQVVSLSTREVTALEELTFEALCAKEDQHREEQAALRAFRLATEGPKKKRSDRCKDDTDGGEDSDGEAFTRDVARCSRRRRREVERDGEQQKADPGEGSDRKEDDKAIGQVRKPLRVSKVGENVLEKIGDVSICKVFRAGALHAISLQCGRHRDAGEATSVQCARDLTLAKGLSQDEAIRRLKRWYVAGLSDADWPGDTQRSSHKKLGGQLLKGFADGTDWSDIGDDDLDRIITESAVSA